MDRQSATRLHPCNYSFSQGSIETVETVFEKPAEALSANPNHGVDA